MLTSEGPRYFLSKVWWYITNTADVEFNGLVASIASRNDKRENLWVFGGTYNGKFVQNAKYLFLYVANNCEEITPVWISSDRTVVRDLRRTGYGAHYMHSRAGLWTLFRAGCVFYTNNLGNFGKLWGLTGGATRVNLWHGNPIKQFPYSWQMTKRRDADFVVVTSSDRSLELFSEISWTVSPKSRFEAEQAIPSGYPRNDVLFDDIPDFLLGVDETVYEDVQEKSRRNTVVGYFPTYRPYETENPLLQESVMGELNSFLAERKCQLLLKPHHSEDLPPGTGEYSNITVLPSEFDIYPIMNDIDILITDYSSVYFGFLLLDRPIILFPYDLEEYRRRNGFMMDYSELAGPVSKTVDGLLDWIDHFESGNDGYSQSRREVRSRFYDDVDGNASERIYNAITERTND